jgi:hypothetical protein
MYRRMKALEQLSPNTKFMYWIESFLISRVRAENFAEIMNKIDLHEAGYDNSMEIEQDLKKYIDQQANIVYN